MKKKLALWRSALLISLFTLLSVFSFAQNNFTVTGKITDESNKPLEGVTVQVKGTTTVTITREDGEFKISVPSEKSILVISHVGYEQQEIVVGNKRQILLPIKAASNSMENVVVIGYGTQKRRNVTGAVSSFDARKVDEQPVQRIDQALVGQLAGVTVKQNTGVPGKGLSVQVRGVASISGGNEPLYVIDGFPLAQNSSNVSNGSFSTGNPLDNINPNDIESIEVLKDAAAAAIYGSRAANGVVLITTKRGQIGKPRINVNVYTGYNEASKKLQMMNGDQWIANATEVINAQYLAKFPTASVNDDRATRLARNGGAFDANLILDPRWSMPGHPGLEYVNWQDAIERKGQIQNYDVSASGGTEAVRYFLSGNYENHDGFVVGVGYKAYALRGNLEVNASDKLKFGVNISPTYSITQDPGVEGKDNIFHQALSMSPVQEDTMGLLPNIGTNGQYIYSNSTNAPLGKLLYNVGTTKRYRTLGTIYGEYQIIKGLSFRTSVNLDNTDNVGTTYVPFTTQNTQTTRTFSPTNDPLSKISGTYSSYRRQTFVNENTFTYNTVIHSVHNLTVLAGHAYNADRFDQTTLRSSTNPSGFSSAIIQTLNAANSVTGNTTSSKNVFISYFGRVLYSYKDKYLLMASYRRDGSSRFGVNNKFGNFPAVSLGWVVTQESFMNDVSVLSYLKLRASYGQNGNNSLGDYASIATIGIANYAFGSTPASAIGQAPNVLANPYLAWEKSKAYDGGFDFGIIKNRITGSFDFYTKTSSSLLLNVPVLAVTGFSSSLTNIGSVKNIGQELEITSRNVVGEFQWTTSINLTHNSNKILALGPGQTQVIIPNGLDVSDAILKVGAPINSIYVLKVVGFLTAADVASGSKTAVYGSNEREGDFKFQDTNGDGIITEADKVIVGHPNPDYTYGITNTFRYKGFDLSFLVQGQQGGSIYSQLGRAITRPGQGRADNHPASFDQRWKLPTDQGEGRFGKSYSTYNSPITSATDWLYSSDYIRLRNLTIGYNLKSVFKRSFVQNARVYFTLENFLGHDKYYNGLNPEAANTAISSASAYPEAGDYGAMPLPRSVIAGINITF
jgi:TonB-dependent starch-binding outer membrane protein SusC